MNLSRVADICFSQQAFRIFSLFAGIISLLFGIYSTVPLAVVFGIALVAAALTSGVIKPLYWERSTGCGKISVRSLLLIYLIIFTSLVVVFYTAQNRSRLVLFGSIILYIISVFAVFYSDARFGLLLFIFSAVVHRGTIFFSSVMVYGTDPHFHANTVSQTVAVAGIAPPEIAERYTITPLYHIFVSSIVNISGTSIHSSSFVITILYLLIPSVLIYILCSYWMGNDTAILSVILFLSSEYIVRWSIEPQPTSFGFIFFVIGVFAFVRWLEAPSRYYEGIFLLIAMTLILTHPVGSFVLLTVVSTILIFSIVTSYKKFSFKLIQPLLSAFAGVGIVWSLFEYGHFQRSFTQQLVWNLANRLRFGNPDRQPITLPTELDAAAGGVTNYPLIHVLGFGLFLFLGVLGGLLLQKRKRSIGIHNLLLPTIGIMFVFSLGTGLVMTLLQPTRWFQFIYVLLGILGGFGLLSISQSLPERYRSITIILVILFYLILMGGAIPAGLDGIVHQDTYQVQNERITPPEYQLIEFAHRNGEEAQVDADYYSGLIIRAHFRGEASTYIWDLETVQTLDGPQILVERTHLYSGHARFRFVTDDGTRQVTGFPPTRLEDCATEVIYNVGGDNVETSRLRYSTTQCGNMRWQHTNLAK